MPTLQLSAQILTKEIILDKTQARVFTLIAFVLLTATGAYVRIPLPFTPVPVTLQTFFVLLSGAVLGRRWAVLCQSAYLALGGMGLPIFSGANAGSAALFGPTGGYLFAFVIAGWLVAGIISRFKAARFAQILTAMLLGSLLILALGSVWLGMIFKISYKQAMLLGFIPFLPGDIIKSFAAALVYQGMQKRAKQIL